MNKNDPKVISHEDFYAKVISKYGDDLKEDFEANARDSCEPPEWV